MGEKLKLLVVDDDRYAQELYALFLDSAKYEIEIAINGYDAVGLYKENEFDLIITDFSMPVMNGAVASNLIREIAKTQQRPYIPIILISANNLNDDNLWGAVTHSADVVLTKPVDFEALHRLIACLVAAK
jgi:CheY-like chemotaxis protein